MECLIIDDCGTDDSISICERMIDEYDGPIRFRILHHGHNRGLSAARNTGLDAATGDFIFFLDGDDEITDDCIKTLMRKVEEYPDVEIVQGNGYMHHLSGNTTVFRERIILPLAVTNDEVRRCFYHYREMRNSVWNKLYRRDFLIKNHLRCQEGVIYENIPWSFDLLKCLSKACFVPDITYHYKLRPHSIVTGTSKEEKAVNFRIIYFYILLHLTSGYERDEFGYYAKKLSIDNVKFSRFDSEFRGVLQMWREKAKEYGCMGLRIRLALSHMLGKFRHGWVVLSCCARIKRFVM